VKVSNSVIDILEQMLMKLWVTLHARISKSSCRQTSVRHALCVLNTASLLEDRLRAPF